MKPAPDISCSFTFGWLAGLACRYCHQLTVATFSSCNVQHAATVLYGKNMRQYQHGTKSKRVMLLHLLYQPHRLGFYLALLLTSLYTARTKETLLPKYLNVVFMNSIMSSRITMAYLLIALKKVTELLLLWSIETILSVFDYLIQQASSQLNYMPFCLR